MQRFRIGLTGLACVFLLVLLAAVFSRASDEEPITENAIAAVASGKVGTTNDVAGPTEPLAELGVAPGEGTIPANETTPQTVPVEDPLRARPRRDAPGL